MTEGATQFITPLTLQTLSRHPGHHKIFDEKMSWHPGHIELADKPISFSSHRPPQTS